MLICLGPCCIPMAAVYPLLLLLVRPLLVLLAKTPLGKHIPAKYLPDGDKNRSTSQANGSCCDLTTGKCTGPSAASSSTDGDKDAVKAVQSQEHWEDLLRTEPLLFVDFTANWCKPCKRMAPVFDGLAAEHRSSGAFAKVDIDVQDLQEVFTRHGGISIPTFHVFKTGVSVDSVTGAAEDKLRTMVAKHVKKTD